MQTKISLVTGGAGFIGSHVVDHLIKMKHKVIVLDDLSGGFRENVNFKSIFVKGSVVDENILDKIFQQHKVSYIYHLAAYAAEGLSHFIRRFNYENNLIGSINLINRAIKFKVKHFVFTSSIAVYGRNQLPMLETLAPKPEDPYGIAKYAIELDLRTVAEMFGLNHTIFRSHNVYGERQNHGDPYRNVLGIFVNNIMSGKPMTVFGDGRQTRAFTHIDDVAPYIAKSVDINGARNETFNIGADKPYTILHLARTIAKAMQREPQIEFLPARNEVAHAYSSHEKARGYLASIRQLGWMKVLIEWWIGRLKLVPENPESLVRLKLWKRCRQAGQKYCNNETPQISWRKIYDSNCNSRLFGVWKDS
ncbi:MAG: NAD-dependent epimerase/dehydratase family protein [Patescibacteria group bacterium]